MNKTLINKWNELFGFLSVFQIFIAELLNQGSFLNGNTVTESDKGDNKSQQQRKPVIKVQSEAK